MSRAAKVHRLAAAALRFSCIVLSVMVVSSCSLLGLDDTIEQWQNLKHRAFENFRDNKFDDAISYYKKAVSTAEKLGPGDQRLPLTLNELARTYAAKEDYRDAVDTYRRSVQLLQAMEEKNTAQKNNREVATGVIDALEGLANASQKLQRMDEADRYYHQALNVLSMGNEPTRKRDIVYEYRSFLLAQGRAKDAEQLERAMGNVSAEAPLPDAQQSLLEEFNKAIRDSESQLKERNLDASVGDCFHAVRCAQIMQNPAKLADALTRLGSLFALQGRNDKAERAFQMAMKNYDIVQADDTRRFNCLIGYSRALVSLSKSAQAEVIGKRALAVAEQHHSPDNHELIETLGTMGMVYSQENRWDKALSVQNHAYQIIREGAPIAGPDVVMAACYTVNGYYLANRKNDAQKFLDKYVHELKTQKSADVVLPARLFDDFGVACLKAKHGDIATWFFNSSLQLLKRAPKEHNEIDRAHQQLKLAAAMH